MKQDGFVEAPKSRGSSPIPGPDECYVKVLIAGVCNTDLEIMKGYMGFEGVVGHEFVGLCESAPHSHQHLVGKRVVGEINLACTTCGVCERGGPRARNHCPKRTVLGILNKNGTYQERLTLPARNLHVVPDSVTTENAAFAEPLAAAFRVVEQNLVPAKTKIAIVGDGKLGLLIGEVLGRHANGPLTSSHPLRPPSKMKPSSDAMRRVVDTALPKLFALTSPSTRRARPRVWT